MTTALVRTTALALLGLATLAAHATNPAQTGVPPTPANRIVGSWTVHGTVAPCAGGPASQILALATFHAGGTTSTMDAAAMTGVPSPWGPSFRGPGHGTWGYDSQAGTYTYQFRFFWFVDANNDGYPEYHGYQDIGPQEIALTADGLGFEGAIHASRWVYDPVTDTHSKAVDLCGAQIGERISP